MICMKENLRIDEFFYDAYFAGADDNRLPLPCGEQIGLVGFGVAVTPFSKGGKRDRAD